MESTRDSSQTKLPKPPSPKSIRFESSRNISFPTLRTLFSVKHSLTQFINKQRNRPNNEDNYYKSLRNSAKSNNRNFNTKKSVDQSKLNNTSDTSPAHISYLRAYISTESQNKFSETQSLNKISNNVIHSELFLEDTKYNYNNISKDIDNDLLNCTESELTKTDPQKSFSSPKQYYCTVNNLNELKQLQKKYVKENSSIESDVAFTKKSISFNESERDLFSLISGQKGLTNFFEIQ